MSNSTGVRVLFVSHTPNLIGGADLCLHELLENFDRSVVSPYVVLPLTQTSARGAFSRALKIANIPYSFLEIVHWVDYGFYGKVSRLRLTLRFIRGFYTRVRGFVSLIKNENIDIVYTNTVTVIEGAIAAWLTRKPHIWHIHEAIDGNVDLLSILSQRFCKIIIGFLSSKIIFPSSFLKSCYHFDTLVGKTEVVTNGVDLNRFKPDDSARQWLGELINIPLSTIRIAVVGSFKDGKRIPDFIRAAALTKTSSQDVVFLIIGSGLDHKVHAMEQLIEQSGISSKFRIIAWHKHIEKIIAGIDLLVITSQQETFGRTVIEAMACGIPVVSTRCGGPEDIIKNAYTGVLVPIASIEKISEAIDAIILDTKMAKNIKDHAYYEVTTKYSIKIYTTKIEAIINAALN